MLEIVGYFIVNSEFPSEKTEQLVRTNGTSILYSISREIVRNVTCMGPYSGLLLPSVSFFEPKPEAAPASQIEAIQAQAIQTEK